MESLKQKTEIISHDKDKINEQSFSNRLRRDVKFSFDGEKVIVLSFGVARIYDINNGLEMAVFNINQHATLLTTDIDMIIWDPKVNLLLAASSFYEYLCIWNVLHQEKIKQLNFGSRIRSISVGGDFELITIGFENGAIQLWEKIGNHEDYSWKLIWSSTYPNTVLNLTECNWSDSIGLSQQNIFLFQSQNSKAISNGEQLVDIEKDNSDYEWVDGSDPSAFISVEEDGDNNQEFKAFIAMMKKNGAVGSDINTDDISTDDSNSEQNNLGFN